MKNLKEIKESEFLSDAEVKEILGDKTFKQVEKIRYRILGDEMEKYGYNRDDDPLEFMESALDDGSEGYVYIPSTLSSDEEFPLASIEKVIDVANGAIYAGCYYI